MGELPPQVATDPIEASRQQKRRLLRYMRIIFLVMLFTVTLLTVLELSKQGLLPAFQGMGLAWIPVGLAVVLGLGAILLDIATPTKKLSTLSAVFFGLLAGLLATVAFGFVIDLVAQAYRLDTSGSETAVLIGMTKIAIGITLCYLAISIVIGTQDDFRLVIPYVEFTKQLRGIRPWLLDTSVLIDGRIVDMAQAGFLQAPVIVPRFVLDEMQKLADSSDRLKRQRGRRGLDVVNRLHTQTALDVSVDDITVPGVIGVDQMIIEVGAQRRAIVVTTDLALAKIGRIRQVEVLNLNDLAGAMRTNLLPGVGLSIEVLRRGENPGQGVGYLEDGTMVVVDDAADLIGEEVDAVVTRSLQTSAGRMIFASLARDDGDEADAVATAAAEPDETHEPVESEPVEPPAAAKADPEPVPRGPLGPGKHTAGRPRTPRNPRRE
jgi:uncharacterized protein YacL